MEEAIRLEPGVLAIYLVAEKDKLNSVRLSRSTPAGLRIWRISNSAFQKTRRDHLADDRAMEIKEPCPCSSAQSPVKSQPLGQSERRVRVVVFIIKEEVT
jgi:hypothetical protein